MSFHSRVLFSALLFLSSLFMISAHAHIADHSGKCLAVENTSNTQGASVVQYSCSQDPSMLWSVEGEGNDQIIRANHSNMCLNVAGRSAANGANIVQWPCAGGINEKWAINAGFDSPIEPPIEPPVEPPVEPPIADKPNFAPIMAEQLSGKCIGVGSSSLFNNADVVQWECIGNDQTIRAVHTGMCLNVAGVSLADGADIVQWPCGGGINEKWAVGSALDATPSKPSIWTEPQDLPLVAVAAAMVNFWGIKCGCFFNLHAYQQYLDSSRESKHPSWLPWSNDVS